MLAWVDLDGGGSQGPPGPAHDSPDPFGWKMRGRVITNEGAAVAGAIILLGERFVQRDGRLVGRQGAVTDEEGAFTVLVYSEQLLAVALHRTIGWSSVVPAPRLDGDSPLVLTIQPPGEVAGSVVRSGEPEQATIVVGNRERTLELRTRSDHDGTFRIPRLAPGTYALAASPSAYVDSANRLTHAEITVRSRAVTTKNIQLYTGAFLAIEVIAPKRASSSTVEYTMLRGVHQPTDAAALATLRELDSASRSLLFAGVDANRVAEFHDVAPGPITACVELDASAFSCKELLLETADSFERLSFDFR